MLTHAYALRSLTERNETIKYAIKDHGIDDFLSNALQKKSFRNFFPSHRIISEAEYISNGRFKQRIQDCLNLLRDKAPEYYSFFCAFNKTIRASETSGADFNNNSIDIGPRWFDATNTDLAAVLIHETVHFWQYEKKYLQQMSDQDCELEALKYQLNVLKRLKAPEEEIQHVQNQRGTHTQAYRYSPW